MPDDLIRQWGDPTLRLVAREVMQVDDLLRRQVLRMQRKRVAAGGAGLAATQVGLLRRVFVFRFGPDEDVNALVNPRVVERPPERVTFREGCLSFNTVTVAVERAAAVRVEGWDLDGNARVLEVEDLGASLTEARLSA